MQIAGSFFDQRLWFRKTDNNPAQAWTEIMTSSNSNNSTFQVRRFRYSQDNANINTGYDNTNWTAMMVGFSNRRTGGNDNNDGVQAILYRCGGNWCIKSDLRNSDSESWIVDVLFIRSTFAWDPDNRTDN